MKEVGAALPKLLQFPPQSSLLLLSYTFFFVLFGFFVCLFVVYQCHESTAASTVWFPVVKKSWNLRQTGKKKTKSDEGKADLSHIHSSVVAMETNSRHLQQC